MPIVSPQLDDLAFDRTVEEMVRRIPVYAPEWTDYNPSDPGISLIQLFAYLAEQVGYRLNRIPEKNHIELLKLLGIRLQPAHAAATRLALLLNNPATLVGYTLRAGARAKAKKGSPPPSFETDVDVDVVPAQPALMVTTKNPCVYDVLRTAAGGYETPPASLAVPSSDNEWLTVAWDGKTPKLKDMPVDPVRLFKRAAQPYVWLGLDYNPVLDAGFRGVRVSLAVQLDDDERPDLTADVRCENPPPAGEDPPAVDWLWYYDAAKADMVKLPGRIDDTTAQLTRSGVVRFDVPLTIGPIPDSGWLPLRSPSPFTPLQACLDMGTAMQSALIRQPDPFSRLTGAKYGTILNAGITAAKNAVAKQKPPLAHPLDPTLRAGVKAWLRLQLPALRAGAASPKIRIIGFNVVAVTNATTVTNELLGRADGRPGQIFTLANGNILAGSLDLQTREDSDPNAAPKSWTEADSLDAAGPFDDVYVLDREAGVITFGDGIHGRIPPLVADAGDVIALKYRWGGGVAGEVPVATIAALDTPATGVSEVVNFVAAMGGRDAETLDQAKLRARKELSTRSRAVTAGDFEWIALQTPGVRVARAEVIPLRLPLLRSLPAPNPPAARCGPALPAGSYGVATFVAPGAVTVIAVPDEPGPEPVPTPSFLRAVARQLDRHRLVTTEVHVASPQYCRLCNIILRVRGEPGTTRSALQAAVEARLGQYLHILKGGPDGSGFPFGAQLHIADLMAVVLRVPGIEHLEALSADYTRTRSQASPRQGQLVLCPTLPNQSDHVALAPDESVSIDVTTVNLSTVA